MPSWQHTHHDMASEDLEKEWQGDGRLSPAISRLPPQRFIVHSLILALNLLVFSLVRKVVGYSGWCQGWGEEGVIEQDGRSRKGP